jgi:hypothetical protein
MLAAEYLRKRDKKVAGLTYICSYCSGRKRLVVCKYNSYLAKAGEQPALRWLEVWFNRKLTFRRHVSEKAAKAQVVAHHIQGLACIVHSPSTSVLHKAVVMCVLPSILYKTEAWYVRQKKPSRAYTSKFVNTRVK